MRIYNDNLETVYQIIKGAQKCIFFTPKRQFFSGERAKPPPQTTLPLGEKHPSRLLSWHSATRPGVTRIFVALET